MMTTRLTRFRGFTLIEFLITVGTIMLLAALMLPGIAASREGMRRMQCGIRLAELVKIVLAYESDHHCLPMFLYDSVTEHPNTNQFAMSAPSIHIQVLSYIDEPMSQLMNWSIPVYDDFLYGSDSRRHLATLLNRRISSFVCPSDGLSTARVGSNNYRGTLAEGWIGKQTPEFPDSGNGVFANLSFPPKLSAVTDGLVNTAMFSERLVGAGNSTAFHRNRDTVALTPDPSTAASAFILCHQINQEKHSSGYTFAGETWMISGVAHTNYTHVFPPNSGDSDCIRPRIWGSCGVVAARSNHLSGVQVARCDGSITFVSNSVNLRTWRAFASRDGGETTLGL